ncbi:MAG: tyrosine-type recombinase/integrase [Candidatus Acidiferrales bacterium]
MKEAESKKRGQQDGLHKRRGIWYYSLVIDGGRRFFSTRSKEFDGRKYQEARKVRAEAIKQHIEGKLPNDMAKWPFDKALPRVCEDRKLHLEEASIRLEQERSKPLLKHFGRRRVAEIDGAAIRVYQTARSKQVGNRTINLEAKLLRHVLKAAKRWALIADDYKALKEDRRGPGRALEPEQEKLLFDTARSKPGWDAAFYSALVASNTTMRGCELKKRRLEDVDLVDRQIVIGKSKTDAGARIIPLNDAALWGCAKLIERANALGATEPEHFLFPAFLHKRTKSSPAPRGTGYDPMQHQKTWRTAWRSLVKATAKRTAEGIQDETARKKAMAPFVGLRFHDLRHSCITRLAETKEASDQTIMDISGHLDRSMLEHYSHIRMAAKRKAVEAICSYVPEDLPRPASTRVQ